MENDALVHDEDYGVCSASTVVQENHNLILHLKVHTRASKYIKQNEPLNLHTQQETYNELLKYNPNVCCKEPVAYEANGSESLPETIHLITDQDNTRTL